MADSGDLVAGPSSICLVPCWLGSKVYLSVAENRYQVVPCNDGGCQVRLPSKSTEKKEGPQMTQKNAD